MTTTITNLNEVHPQVAEVAHGLRKAGYAAALYEDRRHVSYRIRVGGAEQELVTIHALNDYIGKKHVWEWRGAFASGLRVSKKRLTNLDGSVVLEHILERLTAEQEAQKTQQEKLDLLKTAQFWMQGAAEWMDGVTYDQVGGGKLRTRSHEVRVTLDRCGEAEIKVAIAHGPAEPRALAGLATLAGQMEGSLVVSRWGVQFITKVPTAEGPECLREVLGHLVVTTTLVAS